MKLRVGSGFPKWLGAIKAEASREPSERQRLAKLRLDRINAGLVYLSRLAGQPHDESPPSLKRIHQRTRYPLWRIGHPYDRDVCVRLIVHFDGDIAVVVLVGGDKIGVSDQWYDMATKQAELELDGYYRTKGALS